MKKLLSLMIAALLAVCSFAPVNGETVPPALRGGEGMSLADFSTVNFAGETVDGSVFANADVTVFNIWATWCYPCLMEMPDFQLLHEHYEATPEADVQVFGILYYIDPSEIPEAHQIVADAGYTWDQLMMCESFYEVAHTMFPDSDGLGVPQTIIVDRTGTVRAQCFGRFADYNELYGYVNGWYELISAEQPPVILGDADGSGAVTVVDAVLVLRMAMGLVPVSNLPAADVDGSGTVNVADAVIILRTAMGI